MGIHHDHIFWHPIYLIPSFRPCEPSVGSRPRVGVEGLRTIFSWWLFCWLILSIGQLASLLLASCQLILFCYRLLLVYCNMRFTLIYAWFLPFTKNYLKSASLLYGTIATYLGGRYRGRLWRKIARRSGKHHWFFCNYMPDGALIIHCICWFLVVHASLNYSLSILLVDVAWSFCCFLIV